jgi:hypothetical protein
MSAPRAIVLCVVALLAGTSLSIDSMAGSRPGSGEDRRPPAPWTHLPPALARRLHFTTADLPGIPVESDSLRDIRHWPATMVLEGVQYRLGTSRGHVDLGGPIDPSVRDPGAYYEAHYEHPERPLERRGPSYVWLVDSTLVERGYRTASGTRIYTYDAKGTVRQFVPGTLRPRSRFSCEHGYQRTGQEWFGNRGQLVGFQMEGVQYWRGVERTRDDYSVIWRRWFRTLPARGRPTPPMSASSTIWSNVPEELRPLMHVTLDELPQFPAGGESLDDPRRWPATWLVDGQVYQLYYVEYGDQETREGLRHFQDIRVPTSYGAYYSPNGHRDYHVARGPVYTWRADGTLGYREYRTNTMIRHWNHDSQGRLQSYSSWTWSGDPMWSCSRRPPLSRLEAEEWYSPDGELVGFLSQVDRVAYWNGLLVTPAAQMDSLRRWYPKRDPTSWNAPRRM